MTETRRFEGVSREELIAMLSRESSPGEGTADHLLHELRVHQIELEVQNQELRESQQQLEQSRAQYVDLYDFAPVGYLTLGVEGRIRELNLTAAALLGGSRGLLIGRAFAGVIARSAQHAMHQFLATAATSETTTIEIELPTGVIVQFVATVVRNAGNEVAGYRAALVDISELKLLQTRLRFLAEAGETLSSSLDYQLTLTQVARLAVPLLAEICFIDMLDERGDVQRLDVVFADPNRHSASPQEVRALRALPGRMTPQESVIASGKALLVRDMPDGLLAGIAHDDPGGKVMRGLGIRSLIIVPLLVRGRALGALTFIATKGRRAYGPADLKFAEDVARRASVAVDNARLHAEACRAVGARDLVLALVSHDLRGPLNVILHGVEQLGDGARGLDELGRLAVGTVERSASRMARIVEDLLDFSAIEAGRLAIVRSDHAVRALTHDALEVALPAAASKGVILDVVDDLAGDLVVSCDRDRILQVFSNLLFNAIKFTAAGGTVTVSSVQLGAEVVFSVADTGIGIAADELVRVFERFWRKGAGSGSGLGLSIAQGIIATHGGRIWVESQVGVGTTFHFSLPHATH